MPGTEVKLRHIRTHTTGDVVEELAVLGGLLPRPVVTARVVGTELLAGAVVVHNIPCAVRHVVGPPFVKTQHFDVHNVQVNCL